MACGKREQLWVKQLDERRFLMRSLPFFTYGIALGDEVSTDETLTITGVVQRSGHRVLRVAVERDAAERFHQEFHSFLEDERLSHEWHAFGYVAIDLPPHGDLSRLTEWLDPRARADRFITRTVDRPCAVGRCFSCQARAEATGHREIRSAIVDQLPPLDWFGPAWDAELCATKQRVKTPVGKRCFGCGGIITYSAQGVIAPESDEHGVRLDRWHLRCFRKSNAIGSDQV